MGHQNILEKYSGKNACESFKQKADKMDVESIISEQKMINILGYCFEELDTKSSLTDLFEKFIRSSKPEKIAIYNIYLVLEEIRKGEFGRIRLPSGIEKSVYPSGLLWAYFGMQEYGNNKVISLLYKRLDHELKKSGWSTIGKAIDELAERDYEWREA